MRIVSRLNSNVLNSAKTQTIKELSKLFAVAPNLAAKTIRLYPQNSISFLTEGLGEIYDIKAKSDTFVGLNDYMYKWKLRGHQVPKVKFVARVTGGAIAAGGSVGSAGIPFIVACGSGYYNPNNIMKLEDGTSLFVQSGPVLVKEGTFEYVVKVVTNNPTDSVNTNLLQPDKTSGLNGVAYPELSDKGYINTAMAAEEHINYLTKVRYDFSWSADAAATKFLIEDTVNYQGKETKYQYITDQMWMNALEIFHFNKEMELIYGRSTMDAAGRCFLQDPKTGQDIIKGDGLIAQMADSCKQTYTNITLNLLEDIMSDLSLKAQKRTGNVFMLTTGTQGYKLFGRAMRTEHKSAWTLQPGTYVQTKNGKIQLGAEYNAYTWQGNTVIVNVNNVFDHPANVSETDSEGKSLESSKMLFIDMGTYDGVKNIQMIAKDGRSFITGELDGVGGQDGKTSGKVSTPLDGSSKIIIGTMGAIMHNPYSSMMLERRIV